MAQQLSLAGRNIIVYINNKPYNPTRSIQFTVNYNETAIRGIDVPWAQELASNMVDVSGTINGIRTVQSGGIQTINARPAFTDIAASPYISLRIHDRASGEDILLITQAKVTQEIHSINPKGVYELNFSFVGQIPLFANDRI